MDPLVLDTNVLDDTAFLRALASYHGLKRVPAVAYAEAGVHLAQRDRSLSRFDRLLREIGVQVERFERGEARTAAWTGAEVGDFTENARDHLIGSHAASPPRVLVTRNTEDFQFLGPRVLAPHEVREAYGF